MVTIKSIQLATPNQFFLRRKRKLLIEAPESDCPADEQYVGAFIRNLESLGYTPTEPLFSRISKLALPDLTALNAEVLKVIKELVGEKLFKPFYPNFPRQVMEMSEARLYLNAFVHYWSEGKLFPNTEVVPRPPLKVNGKIALKPLDIGTRAELESVFTQLASSNTSISTADKDDIAWFIAYYGEDIEYLLPEKMPNRETKAVVVARLFELTSLSSRASEFCNTATDVLRLCCALSNGDVSLGEATAFRQFSRPERRLLMQLLEGQNNLVEDMLRWKGRWIRLGERLHPGEFARNCPQAYHAFDVLRNNLPSQTYNSKIEAALAKRDVDGSIELLNLRGGYFARKLDHLLRLDNDSTGKVLDAFSRVTSKVSTPVLLQLKEHFVWRSSMHESRIFMPKGDVAKTMCIKNTLPAFSAPVNELVIELCNAALVERFKKLPPLGKCYIDPELKNFILPFSQRSASKALRTAARGSRLQLPEADTLRFFIWWKNGASRADLDLSAVMFKRDFTFAGNVTYYELKNFGGHHSGDIVDAPHGASEFIDVSQKKCLNAGVRYILMTINSFTAQPFCDLPECFAGWMSRSEAASGEIYEPKTVQDKLDVTSNSKISIPALFDLEAKQVIWMDLALKDWPFWYNTVAANLWGMQLMVKSMVELSKPNIYDLLQLHVQARGELVSDETAADTVFSVENGTPFDLPKIASEFMAD